MTPLSSAARLADRRVVVPTQSEPGFVDATLEACRAHGVRLLVPTHDGELPLLAAARERFAEIRHHDLDLGAGHRGDRPRQDADPRLARRPRLSHRASGHTGRGAGGARRLGVAAVRQAARRLGRHRRAARGRLRRPCSRRRRRRRRRPRRARGRTRPRAHRRRAGVARRTLRRRRTATPYRGARRRGRKGRDGPRPGDRRLGAPRRRGAARGLRRAQRADLRRPRPGRHAGHRDQHPLRRRLPAGLRSRRALSGLDDRGDPGPALERRPTAGATALSCCATTTPCSSRRPTSAWPDAALRPVVGLA